MPFADQKIKSQREIPPDLRTMLSQKEVETDDILAKASTTLQENYKLKFGAEHIRYLIVATEGEIPEMVDFIEGLQGKSENELGSCTNYERKRLTARLISMAQIQEDF